jgi:ubiquinone/menaquinone biosynthesis C-methylase UbiE
METVGVDPKLQQSYDDYYRTDISEWRELGAKDKADNILRLCRAHEPVSILDVGAGEGSVLQCLADRGFGRQYSALDISASGVERIRERHIPGLVECRQFDGYNIPYPDASFDLAILSHVVEHVEHPRLLLHEAARVGKLVFVEVPLEHNRRLPRDYVWDAVGHINFYTAQTIRLLVQSCGYEVIAQIETHSARQLYKYRLGRKGAVIHMIKEVALRAMPATAQRLWTYHSSLLIRARRLTTDGKTGERPR